MIPQSYTAFDHHARIPPHLSIQSRAGCWVAFPESRLPEGEAPWDDHFATVEVAGLGKGFVR
jgi:hypothetical protein